MFHKILLPVDLTDKHQRARDVAVELARQGAGEITLLHVIELIPGLSKEEESDFYNRLEKTAHAHLQRRSQNLAGRKITWRKQVLLGSRAREVARYAAENGTDLIVLTAPRPDPNHPAAGWGSLSWKVGILAPCPVLLVK